MGNQWWLRTQDEVFGPVTRDNLLEWARMGRIQPGQEVSDDGESWRPATEVDFLDMRWSIDIGDGTPRGPFNKQAAQALMESGRLPRGSRLVETAPAPAEDGPAEDGPAEDAAKEGVSAKGEAAPESASQSPAASAEVEELRRQISTLQAGLRAAEARADDAERRAERARTEAKAALKAADVAEARLAAVQTENAQRDAARETSHAEREKALEAALVAKDAERDEALKAKTAEMTKALAEAEASRNAALAAKDEEYAAAAAAKDEAHAAAMKALEEERVAAIAAKEDECATARAERDRTIAERDAVITEKDAALSAATAAREEARKIVAEAQAKVDALTADLARVTAAKTANDAANEERIKSLTDDLKRLPPTAQLAADAQAAVYAIMKEEADELSAAIEAENREAEALREYRRNRAERLLARRQEILRRIGTDAEDMSRRALKEFPEDPRTMHMRQELEALRLLQEKSALEADRKIRDLAAKLRDSDGEVKRLRQQSADVTVIYRQLQEAREKLMRREKELMEERQRAEAERQRHAADEQTLLARLSSLEMGMPGATHQSREARTVRLAPWMGLKK